LFFFSQLSSFPFHLANEDILLNLNRPEANNGMLVLCGEGIRVKNPDPNKGDFVVDALTIYRPLDDAQDFLDKRIKAQLLPDQSGIEVTWPTLPDYFRDHKTIQALEGRNVCERTALRHSTFVGSFKNDNQRHMKKIFLHFPDKMTCNSNHFNDGKEKGHLKTYFRLVPGTLKIPNSSDTIDYFRPFVFWKVVVNTKVPEQVANENTTDEDETQEDVLGAVQQMFKKMGVSRKI
jgi:hypothetical protein